MHALTVMNRDTAAGHVTGPYVYNHFLSLCFPQFEYQPRYPPKKSFLNSQTPVTEGPASRLSPSLVVGEPFRLWGGTGRYSIFKLTLGHRYFDCPRL